MGVSVISVVGTVLVVTCCLSHGPVFAEYWSELARESGGASRTNDLKVINADLAHHVSESTKCFAARTVGGMDKGNDHGLSKDPVCEKAYMSARTGADNVKSSWEPMGAAFEATLIDLSDVVTMVVKVVVWFGDVASPLLVRVSPDSPKNHENCGESPKVRANEKVQGDEAW